MLCYGTYPSWTDVQADSSNCGKSSPSWTDVQARFLKLREIL